VQSPCFDVGTHPHEQLLLQSLLLQLGLSARAYACAAAMQRMLLERQWR